MDKKEAGMLIAKCRKEAGYTQAQLAELLFVTDKAVSKWERGLCLPDVSLLTKLSTLLDVDVDYLISGASSQSEHKWCGEIRVNSVRGEVAGKPVLHYLLSYFMLVGITDISIITTDREYVNAMHLEKYGLKIGFYPVVYEKTMVVYDRFILFGVNLTRQLGYCISENKNMSLALNGISVPIAFSHFYTGSDSKEAFKDCEKKQLGRGTVYIPLSTPEDVNDASDFVRIYETHDKNKIADLEEIAKLRNLVG